MYLKKILIINNRFNYLLHIILFIWIFGENRCKGRINPIWIISGLCYWRKFTIILWNIRKEFFYFVHTCVLVFCYKMSHARFAGMRNCASQLLKRNFLP